MMQLPISGRLGVIARRYRRRAIAVLGLMVLLALCPVPGGRSGPAAGAATVPASVQVTTASHLNPVPAQYLGFSIEPANVCYASQLAESNPAFLQLFKNFGQGTIRVGGDTGDATATWSPTGQASCDYDALVMTPSQVDSFFSNFVEPIGYGVSWQVPLFNPDNLASDAAEAAYVAKQPGIDTVEFGNEPNLYPNASTEYQTYIDQWNTAYEDYVADGGTAAVSGPGVGYSGTSTYITNFLAQDASKLSEVTAHFYDGSSHNPASTCQNLLTFSKLQSFIESNVALASSYDLPFVMAETNTYAQGGVIGVSNAFCSALWAADYTLFALQEGAQGLDFHGAPDYPPGNKGGTLEYFSPILDNGTPAPEYYGLLFYHEMTLAGGHLVTATVNNATDLDAYGVVGTDRKLRVALVNRSGTRYKVTINTDVPYAHAQKITLKAPALDSTSGVTLGAASVATNGTFQPIPAHLKVDGTSLSVTVAPNTGTILTYSK
jgi:hypothetical protein